MTKAQTPNFDRIVPIYDFFKTVLFLGAIQRCQYYHFPLLKGSRKILVIGGGTGRIIRQIRRYSNFEKLDYVDSSSKMIREATKYSQQMHVELENRIQFHSIDIFAHSINNKYDVIIAPFVLDCFTDDQLDLLGKKFSSWLMPGGFLLVSDFCESRESLWSRTLSRIITRILYLVFNRACGLNLKRLPNFNRLFQVLPCSIVEKRPFFSGVLKSVVYRLDEPK